MGFLQNLFRGREIQKLEELLNTAPAPSIFVRLRVLYLASGNQEKADGITNRGAKLFPESEVLNQAVQDVNKIQIDAEKRRLLARIEQFPSPILYARLAELYIKEEDYIGAMEVCRTGGRSYPDYGGLSSVMGKIASLRQEYDQAVEHLAKAVQQDQYNYNALILLTENYLRLGMRDQGKETLEKIFLFSPGDEKTTRWLNDFDARAIVFEEEGKSARESAPSPAAAPSDPAAKETPPLSEPITDQDPLTKKSSGVGTSLHLAIAEIRRVAGVRGSILIDPYGLVIASDLPERMDEELAGALIVNICRTVDGFSAELTLGNFEEGIIDSNEGTIHLLKVEEMTMGVFASIDTKTGLLQRAIHTFAEKALDVHH